MATLAVFVVVLGVASEPVDAHIARVTAGSDVAVDFKYMDDQLTKAIAEAKAGQDVGSRIDTVKRVKLEIVSSQLSGPVDGVKGSEWFSQLDCVDVELQLAKITDEGKAFVHAHRTETVPPFLEAAQRCKEKLENEVRNSAKAAQTVLADFNHMDGQLTKAIAEAKAGQDVGSRIDTVKRVKLEIVSSQLSGPVDGVKGSEWFSQLDCVDVELQLAKITDEGKAFVHAHRTETVPPFLEAAQRCKEKLENNVLKSTPHVSVGKPSLQPIHAVFRPAPAGQRCSRPYCTTVYTENASGHDLAYKWAVSIPADPNCAKGFEPNKPNPDQASWYHADESEGGYCNHNGNTYDASGYGHPGTVTVTVSNAHWSCTATYHGTQGANGTPTGDGPAPESCRGKPKP